jgi:hypothetical protein
VFWVSQNKEDDKQYSRGAEGEVAGMDWEGVAFFWRDCGTSIGFAIVIEDNIRVAGGEWEDYRE